jgi:hypothetical protein
MELRFNRNELNKMALNELYALEKMTKELIEQKETGLLGKSKYSDVKMNEEDMNHCVAYLEFFEDILGYISEAKYEKYFSIFQIK